MILLLLLFIILLLLLLLLSSLLLLSLVLLLLLYTIITNTIIAMIMNYCYNDTFHGDPPRKISWRLHGIGIATPVLLGRGGPWARDTRLSKGIDLGFQGLFPRVFPGLPRYHWWPFSPGFPVDLPHPSDVLNPPQIAFCEWSADFRCTARWVGASVDFGGPKNAERSASTGRIPRGYLHGGFSK